MRLQGVRRPPFPPAQCSLCPPTEEQGCFINVCFPNFSSCLTCVMSTTCSTLSSIPGLAATLIGDVYFSTLVTYQEFWYLVKSWQEMTWLMMKIHQSMATMEQAGCQRCQVQVRGGISTETPTRLNLHTFLHFYIFTFLYFYIFTFLTFLYFWMLANSDSVDSVNLITFLNFVVVVKQKR